jgi:hypothetical protein
VGRAGILMFQIWEERVLVKEAKGIFSMAHRKSHRSKSDKARRGPRQPSGTLRRDSQPNSTAKSSADKLAAEANRARLGLEGLREIQIYLVKLFGRIERCREKLDEAFGGQPFLPDVPPDCPANRRRFWAYFEEASALTELLWRAVELWMITCGMKWEDDWIPLLVAEAKLRAPKRDVNVNQG